MIIPLWFEEYQNGPGQTALKAKDISIVMINLGEYFAAGQLEIVSNILAYADPTQLSPLAAISLARTTANSKHLPELQLEWHRYVDRLKLVVDANPDLDTTQHLRGLI